MKDTVIKVLFLGAIISSIIANDMGDYREDFILFQDVDKIGLDEQYFMVAIMENLSRIMEYDVLIKSVTSRISFDESEYREGASKYEMSKLIENLCASEKSIKDSYRVRDEDEADMLNQKEYLEHIIAVNNLDVAYLNGLKGFFQLLSLSDDQLALKKEELALLLKYTHAQRRLNVFKLACATLDRLIEIDQIKLNIDQEALQKIHDDLFKKTLDDLPAYSTVEHYQGVIDYYKNVKKELALESQQLLSQIEKKDALLSNIDYIANWNELNDERFKLFAQLRELQFNEKIVDSIIFKIEELKTQASPEKKTFADYLKQLGYA